MTIMTISTCYSMVPTSKLQPHPLNASLYGDGADADLVESVKQNGVLSPILATKNNIVISGHRRLNAAMMAGLKSVPVIYTRATDQLEIEELLITANTQRQKTAEQIAREAARLLEIEKERAKKRQLANLNNQDFVPVNLPEREKGEAREIVAEKLGVKPSTMERSIKVVQKADELRDAGEGEQAAELLDTLNNKSVNAAYQKIKPGKKQKTRPTCTGCNDETDQDILDAHEGLCACCHQAKLDAAAAEESDYELDDDNMDDDEIDNDEIDDTDNDTDDDDGHYMSLDSIMEECCRCGKLWPLSQISGAEDGNVCDECLEYDSRDEQNDSRFDEVKQMLEHLIDVVLSTSTQPKVLAEAKKTREKLADLVWGRRSAL